MRMSLIFLIFFLTGCATTELAPVVNGSKHGIENARQYSVGKGETLYTIAWRYGLDFRALAITNHLAPPYHLSTGQRLILEEDSQFASATSTQDTVMATPINLSFKPTVQHTIKAPKYVAVPANNLHSSSIKARFNWPVRGKLISRYSALNKGIDIVGSKGLPIQTTGAGMVVYAGSGLRGYGELIIIKHNDEFLSAYAHNDKIMVKEGEAVKQGQVIATMGSTGAKRVMLHFEIRRAGKPVDPLKYLQR